MKNTAACTNDQRKLTAYIDGSYTKNKKYAGYAAILLEDDKIVESISGAVHDEELVKLQNVAVELVAAMKAVEYALRNKYSNILLCHDFSGIQHIATGKWGARKPFVKKYKKYISMAGKLITIEYQFVPSHSGDIYNNMADRLARACGSVL